MLSRYLRDLSEEFRGYGAAKLLKDLLAGLTVTSVALPLALAFGVSSGADAASGLITAIIAGLVISALSGAYYQISGPTGAMAAILISVTARHGIQGVFAATLLAGAFLLLAGVFRLGRVVTWIPAPVITGFTSGIAVVIALGQADNLFGVASEGESVLDRLASYGRLGFSPDLTALFIGLFVIAFMLAFPKKWNAVVPGSLIAVALATAGSILFGLDAAVVGEIPKTLLPAERLNIFSLSAKGLWELAPSALGIAMLGLIESLLCGASAGQMTGKPMDNDRELVAQGVGNLILPFFGGIPATAAIARTSVAIKSGAQTRLTGIFHALGLLFAMFAAAPIMSRIPLSALAGVLVVTAWRMNEWHQIRYIFSRKLKGAMLKYTLTMAATVIFDLTTAIVIGILCALVLFVAKSCGTVISVEDVDMRRVGGREGGENWVVVYVTGPLFFLTADKLRARLDNLREPDIVILSMRGVPTVDITAVKTLSECYAAAEKRGQRLLFSSVQPQVMEGFRRAGFADLAGEDAFHFSVDRVLATLSPSESEA